jgi:hypothetical protein
MKMVRNTVGGVKFTFPMTACSVLVAVWHYECHRLSISSIMKNISPLLGIGSHQD